MQYRTHTTPFNFCHRKSKGNRITGPEEIINSPLIGQVMPPNPPIPYIKDTRSSKPDDVISVYETELILFLKI